MALNVTETEYNEVMAAVNAAIKELNSDLSNITIRVGKGSADVITAIKYIFGPNFINSDGTSAITYEMFATVADKLRQAGSLKVQESI